jgi:hypothetical protein
LGGSNSQALDCGIKKYCKMLVIWRDACDIFTLDKIAKIQALIMLLEKNCVKFI